MLMRIVTILGLKTLSSFKKRKREKRKRSTETKNYESRIRQKSEDFSIRDTGSKDFDFGI